MRFVKPSGDDGRRDAAAALLITDGALIELSLVDARAVVGYMRPRRAQAGEVLIREGAAYHPGDFMALILEGEITIERSIAAAHGSMVVSVEGPGGLIGEVGILDGGPRSATWTAATDVLLATWTSDSLMRLLSEQPVLGNRLLLALCKRLAGHLREANRKTLTFAQVCKAGQQELEAAHAVNMRLLDQIDRLSR